MSALSELGVKWQLPKPNEVRKVVIPYGMLKGTYEISLGELRDTSDYVLTSNFIRENYDPSHKFELKDFCGSFYSDSDVKGSEIELAQWQHLLPVWYNPEIDQQLHDSLKFKMLYTDSTVARQQERFFIGRPYVAENSELSLDLSRPHAEIAFSDGLVNELDVYTLWKPLAGRKAMKATVPTRLFNIRDDETPIRFVGTLFGPYGGVYAVAGWLPLYWVFYRGARSVKKVE